MATKMYVSLLFKLQKNTKNLISVAIFGDSELLEEAFLDSQAQMDSMDTEIP